MKKFRWVIDMEDESHGVKAISFVDEPAMESDFIKLNKQKIQPKLTKFEVEGYKNVLAGLALIPDKEIPRIDPETGEEYVGYFDAETIEQIRNKFHKEEQTQNVNENHEEDEVVEAFLIESYILNSEKQVEDLSDKGIEGATIGSWFVAYKVEDDEVFNEALEKELNGFSVELYANRILESFKYNNYNKNKLSMKNLIEKFKNIINEFEAEGTKFVSANIADLGINVGQDSEEWTIDEAIYQIVVDEAGEETHEDIEDGDYVLVDGMTLVVAGNVLTEIKEAEAEETEPEEEDLKSETVEQKTDEVKAETEEEVVAEEDEDVSGGDAKKTLEELIDMSKDGYYTVEVVVEGGSFSYGTIYANTWKELELKAEKENVTLKEEIVTLKAKIKEPIADPKLGFEKGKKEDINLSKLSTYERIALKNNLPLV